MIRNRHAATTQEEVQLVNRICSEVNRDAVSPSIAFMPALRGRNGQAGKRIARGVFSTLAIRSRSLSAQLGDAQRRIDTLSKVCAALVCLSVLLGVLCFFR